MILFIRLQLIIFSTFMIILPLTVLIDNSNIASSSPAEADPPELAIWRGFA